MRTFPDINFVDTDTTRLVTALISGYEHIAERRLFPGDPVRMFILWVADIMVQERVIINETARQNVPRFAEGEFLDSLAEIFKDTERLPPVPAVTTLRFTVSAPQTSALIISEGTRVSIDGDVMFATTAPATVAIGELTAETPAVCITTEEDPKTGKQVTIGAKGNGFMPGQINQIVDLFQFFESVENTTVSAGGADVESDEAFYDRLRLSFETFSTAGPRGAYEYWAKTASARIVDVMPLSPTPGHADIRILLENGEFPDEEVKKLVLDTLTADKVRPFTDYVTVAAPDPVKFKLDFTYFIPRPSQDSATMIQREVNAAVKEYINWQTSKMGRDINPDRLIMLVKKAGAKRLVIRSPAFTVIRDSEVAVLDGAANVIYGGLEDE
jgi:phage-related baseplate assembly protein